MRKLILPVGLLLIISAGIWKLGISPQFFAQRFPDGWMWEVNNLAYSSFTPEETGEFPEGTTLADDPINLNTRKVTASTAGVPTGSIQMTDFSEFRDPITNAVIWELTLQATVDATTGRYLEGKYAGDYYFLPPNPDKNTTYVMTNSNYERIPMTFQREETISGILVYLFAFYGEWSNALAHPNVVLAENQAIMCVDLALEFWIEPITGEIVKFREWCEGDYVIDTTTQDRLTGLARWGAETMGEDIIQRVVEIPILITRYNLIQHFIPMALLLAGLGLVGSEFLAKAWGMVNTGKQLKNKAAKA